jgi:hypothetical protein
VLRARSYSSRQWTICTSPIETCKQLSHSLCAWAAEHVFKIPIVELSEPKIYIHVYDDDSALRDTFLGEVLLDTQAILGLMATPGSLNARVVCQRSADFRSLLPANCHAVTIPTLTRCAKQVHNLGRCSQPSKVGEERFAKECSGGQLTMSLQFDFPQLALGTLIVKVKRAVEVMAVCMFSAVNWVRPCCGVHIFKLEVFVVHGRRTAITRRIHLWWRL